MISTSQDFQDKINSKTRKIFVKVTLNFTDLLLDPTVSGDSSQEAYISRTEQLVNGRNETTYKYFSLDGSFVLGDEYHPCPDTEVLGVFNEMGYWSEGVAGSGGTFSTSQKCEITYSKRRVTSFLVVGDEKRSEYPVDFDVEFYDGVTLISTEVVIGNTLVVYEDAITPINNIDKVVLIIKKWSHEGRNAKITELATSVRRVFDGSLIEYVSVSEKREISDDNTVPVGNIAINRGALSIVNVNREFDANNNSSKIQGLVRPNVRAKIELGQQVSNGIEYITLMDGWSGPWTVREKSLYASASIRGRLEILDQSEYRVSSVIVDETFKQWFERVLSDGGLTPTQYNVSSTLAGTDYIVPFGWFEPISHKAALEELARASGSVVYEGRDGVIYVKLYTDFPTTTELTYTRSDYSEKDDQPIYENIANRVIIKTAPLVKTTGQSVYTTTAAQPEDIAASTTTDYLIYYPTPPIADQAPSISPPVGGVSITASTHYSWGSRITVQNTNPTPKQFQFSVTGSIFTTQGEQQVEVFDQASIDDNGERVLTVDGGRFLQKKALATINANSLLSTFKNPSQDLKISLTPGGNPSLELGDKIGVTDKYITKYYNITATDIRVEGGLSMRHEGRVI